VSSIPYEYKRTRLRKFQAQTTCFQSVSLLMPQDFKFRNMLCLPSMKPETGCVGQALRQNIIDTNTKIVGIENELSCPHIKQKLNRMGFDKQNYDMINQSTENITEQTLDKYMNKLKIDTFEFVYLDLCGQYTKGEESFIRKLQPRLSHNTFFMVNFNGSYRTEHEIDIYFKFLCSASSYNRFDKCYGKVTPRVASKAGAIMTRISKILDIEPAWFIRYKDPDKNKAKPCPMGISCFSNRMNPINRKMIMDKVDQVQNSGYVGVDCESTAKNSKVFA